MPQYSQANRPLRVETVLGANVLLLESFSGQEGVSMPYSYTLDLASPDPALAAADLLRSPAAIKLQLPDGKDRTIHGLFSKFVQRGQADDLTFYRAELVPWLWFLSLSTDCRIFQEMTVLEIVEQVFRDQGYSDFKIKCVRSYPVREYCVQYRETHLNFVSRLLEEEGIFYFFEHSGDKHVLVLTDDNTSIKPCPSQATARVMAMAGAQQEEDVVTMVESEHAVYPGKVTLGDYDYLQPRLRLESTAAGNGREELYEYPARYAQLADGERLARTRLEEQEAWQQVVRGEGTCRAFQSGYRFELKEHYRRDANQAYHLVRVMHAASVGGYRAGAN
ncbi:MAG TPA: type VI secretion system tip protein TssI/VgrG, partial [Gemmatimonadota bacterium]|nr:type VI secretion system tip protein TssI/VgrG [Gemmatimonadota bacterium]